MSTEYVCLLIILINIFIVLAAVIERKWDAVCHSGSYGHEDGLLEIMGTILTDEESECDSVVGWLTAEQVMKRVVKED